MPNEQISPNELTRRNFNLRSPVEQQLQKIIERSGLTQTEVFHRSVSLLSDLMNARPVDGIMHYKDSEGADRELNIESYLRNY